MTVNRQTTRTLDLEVELRQLRSAGAGAAAVKEFAEAVDRFGDAMEMLGAGRLTEAVDPLRKAAAVARRLHVPAFEAKCAEKLAMVWRLTGRHSDAISMAESALQLTTDPKVRIEALNTLTVVYLTKNDGPLARRHALDTVALLTALPDDAYKAQFLAATTYNIGEAYVRENVLSEARPFFEGARDMFRAMGMEEAVAKADTGLSAIAFAEGRLDDAKRSVEAAMATFERAGNRSETAIALHSLAKIDFARGDLDAAIASGTRAAAIQRELGRRDLAMKVMSDVAAMEAAARAK